ncbi:hypothetical protein BH18ACI5_BH18ACI5_22450 [soil metagenome]
MYRSFVTGIASLIVAAAVSAGGPPGAARSTGQDCQGGRRRDVSLEGHHRPCRQLEGAHDAGLLKPENKAKLTTILTYHVVAGRLDAQALMDKARMNGGTAELTTVSGDKLWAVVKDGKLTLKDEKGLTAAITVADVYQSNGVIHVINGVVLAVLAVACRSDLLTAA